MLLHRLRKLGEITSTERAELMAAQWALLRAQVMVWTRPVGRFVTPTQAASQLPASSADADAVAQRLGLAVTRAADHGVFRPLCLVRAVALHRLLESRGIRGSRICVGVRQQRGRFAAHAWVEYQGQPLGDSPKKVGSFTPLSDMQVVSPQ